MTKKQNVINEIMLTMGVAPVSVAFDRRLTEAARAGEQDAIRRENERQERSAVLGKADR